MMKPADIGAAYVHPRPASHRFESLEDLDVLGLVSLAALGARHQVWDSWELAPRAWRSR